MMCSRLSASLCLVLLSAPALADDVSGELALNGSRATGNTEALDAGFTGRVKQLTGDWENIAKTAFNFGREDGDTVQQRFELGLETRREIGDRIFAYGNADYFQDDFGPYKFGYFGGGGIGYRILINEPMTWSVEAGPGFRQQKSRLPMGDPSGEAFERESELAGRAYSTFEWQMNDNVNLYNRTQLITSSSDTYIWNDIGVTADLFGDLALRASYRVDFHTDVPIGTEDTDTITRIGIVYAID